MSCSKDPKDECKVIKLMSWFFKKSTPKISEPLPSPVIKIGPDEAKKLADYEHEMRRLVRITEVASQLDTIMVKIRGCAENGGYGFYLRGSKMVHQETLNELRNLGFAAQYTSSDESAIDYGKLQWIGWYSGKTTQNK